MLEPFRDKHRRSSIIPATTFSLQRSPFINRTNDISLRLVVVVGSGQREVQNLVRRQKSNVAVLWQRWSVCTAFVRLPSSQYDDPDHQRDRYASQNSNHHGDDSWQTEFRRRPMHLLRILPSGACICEKIHIVYAYVTGNSAFVFATSARAWDV